jgi:hypothetical protein
MYGVAGLVITVDNVVKTVSASSEITFEPPTEVYILKAVYQGLTLYS